jgi:amidase
VPIGYVASTVAFDVLSKRLTEYVGYTPFMNVTGGAAMSVPLHWTADGIPVGMHFAGPAGSEKTLFQLAYELEAAKPWAGLKPPVWFGG